MTGVSVLVRRNLFALVALLCGFALVAIGPGRAEASERTVVAGDWPANGYDSAGSAANGYETAITAATVGSLTPLWSLPGVAGGIEAGGLFVAGTNETNSQTSRVT